MGQKNLAVLTGDHINKGILTRKCMANLYGCKVGFYCIKKIMLQVKFDFRLKVFNLDLFSNVSFAFVTGQN